VNYYDKRNWADLEPCSVCGRFAGVRKYSASVPEKFFVVCRYCGHKTKPHDDLRQATREWNHERKAKNAKN
jgi:hypothetical protein